MKNHVIINWRAVFYAAIFGAMTVYDAWFLFHKFSAFGLLSFIVLMALTVGWIVSFSNYIRISEQNVTIYYAFGQRIFARWEDINEIQTHTYKLFRDYRFIPMRGKRHFFQNGSFPKSRRLKKLIERYWNGIIY